MNKREFLRQAMLLSAGAYIAPSVPLMACQSKSKKEKI
jgi:hypothetical protein